MFGSRDFQEGCDQMKNRDREREEELCGLKLRAIEFGAPVSEFYVVQETEHELILILNEKISYHLNF